ncbi:MAG: hypothetical protein F6K30_13485 [Cyanothece sp. SIO2G6]|nr:hypothetical protein [Cyanothece sp. SIO2G6]
MTITPPPNSPQTTETHETPTLLDPVLQEETNALIDAIRRRAIEEAEVAGEMTREIYLTTVRQLRETLEQNQVIKPTEIGDVLDQWQKETEQNWQLLVDDVTGFGDRLTKAAQAAWDVMTDADNNTPES